MMVTSSSSYCLFYNVTIPQYDMQSSPYGTLYLSVISVGQVAHAGEQAEHDRQEEHCRTDHPRELVLHMSSVNQHHVTPNHATENKTATNKNKNKQKTLNNKQ